MSTTPIEALSAVGAQTVDPVAATSQPVPARAPLSFAKMMLDGVEQTNQKLVDLEKMQTMAALDDKMPPHQVFVAAMEARGAMLLMMQVRARLVEGYQEIMRMQL